MILQSTTKLVVLGFNRKENSFSTTNMAELHALKVKYPPPLFQITKKKINRGKLHIVNTHQPWMPCFSCSRSRQIVTLEASSSRLSSQCPRIMTYHNYRGNKDFRIIINLVLILC